MNDLPNKTKLFVSLKYFDKTTQKAKTNNFHAQAYFLNDLSNNAILMLGHYKGCKRRKKHPSQSLSYFPLLLPYNFYPPLLFALVKKYCSRKGILNSRILILPFEEILV